MATTRTSRILTQPRLRSSFRSRRAAMHSWLLDNFAFILILLGIVAAACAYAWWTSRRRYYAVAAGTAAALMAAVCLLVYLLPLLLGESDGQQIERKVREM